MPDLTVTAADPAASAGPAPARSRPGAAGLFGDALDAAVAGGRQDAGDPAQDAAAAAPQAPSLLGAAAALAALLGRTAAAPAAPGDQAAAAATAPSPLPGALPAQPPVAGQPAALPAPVAPVVEEAPAAGAAPTKPAVKSVGDDEHGDADDAQQSVAAGPGDPSAQPVPPVVPLPPVTVQPQALAAAAPAAAGAATTGVRGVAARTGAGHAGPVPAAGPTAAGADAARPATTTAPATAAAASVATAVAPPAQPDRGDSGAADASQQVLAVAPAQQVAQPAPVAAPAAPAPVATTDASVAQQLQGPLLSLRSAPEGQHVMVVRISPEHLGSVTIHATVSQGDLAVQLFASSDGARGALQSMLSDLRGDLGSGAAGTATTLSLGTGDAPQQQNDQQGPTTWIGTGARGGSGSGGTARDERAPWTAPIRPADGAPADLRIPGSSSALLDVLA